MRITTPSMESIRAEPDSRQSWFRVVRYWGPVGLYAAFIFYLSSQSFFPDTLPSYVEKLGDKVHHMMTYGLFGLLWYRAFRFCGGTWAAPRAVFLAILASALYGVTDELHQWFVPLREADPWDLMADTAGAAVAVISVDRWLTRRPAAATVETEGRF